MHDLLHRLKSRPSRSAAMPPSSSSVLTSEEHSTHSPFCAPSSIGDNSPNKSHQAPTKIRTHRRRSQVSAHASHVPSCPVTPRVSSVSTREPHLQSSKTSSHLIHSRQSPPANTILRPNYANRCKIPSKHRYTHWSLSKSRTIHCSSSFTQWIFNRDTTPMEKPLVACDPTVP